MSRYPTGLIYRTWKVLKTGVLGRVSPKLTEAAGEPLPDFFLRMLRSPSIAALQIAGLAVSDDEFMMYVASEEGGPPECVVTNRKLIFFVPEEPLSLAAKKRAKTNAGLIEARSCLFSSVTAVEPHPRRQNGLVLKRKRGNPLELDLSTPASAAAIRYAAESAGRKWEAAEERSDEMLAELQRRLERDPDFAAAVQKAHSIGAETNPVTANRAFEEGVREVSNAEAKDDGRAQTKAGRAPAAEAAKAAASIKAGETTGKSTDDEEETWGSIFAEMIPMFVGFAAFVIFLLANGAPIFQGGRAVVWWLSDDNMGYFYGAIAAGLAAAFFWPRKK